MDNPDRPRPLGIELPTGTDPVSIRKRIEAMTAAIVKKMLDRPIARLKNGSDKGLYMEALEDLFDVHPTGLRPRNPAGGH